MNNLPEWYDVDEKDCQGEPLNPLEQFIHEYEPAGAHETNEFRARLNLLLEFIITGSHQFVSTGLLRPSCEEDRNGIV